MPKQELGLASAEILKLKRKQNLIVPMRQFTLMIALSGVLAMCGSSAFAGVSGLCESTYKATTDVKRFPNRSAALVHLEAVKEQCRTDPMYLSRISAIYFVEGRIAEADTAVEAGLRVAPNHKELLFGKGDIRLSKADTAGAMAIAAQMIDLYPSSWGGPYLMQRSKLESRQFSEAVRYGDIAIKLSPEFVPTLYLNNAVASYNAGQNKQCVDYAQMAMDRDPRVVRHAWGINEAIYALHELGRRSEALALAKRRKAADPKWQQDPTLVKALKIMGVIQ
jgi:tetratricopeptide (TPR) repeat protein